MLHKKSYIIDQTSIFQQPFAITFRQSTEMPTLSFQVILVNLSVATGGVRADSSFELIMQPFQSRVQGTVHF